MKLLTVIFAIQLSLSAAQYAYNGCPDPGTRTGAALAIEKRLCRQCSFLGNLLFPTLCNPTAPTSSSTFAPTTTFAPNAACCAPQTFRQGLSTGIVYIDICKLKVAGACERVLNTPNIRRSLLGKRRR